MAISEVDLISALNRINQSLRTVSIVARIAHFTIEGLVSPINGLIKSMWNFRNVTTQAQADEVAAARAVAESTRRAAENSQRLAAAANALAAANPGNIDLQEAAAKAKIKADKDSITSTIAQTAALEAQNRSRIGTPRTSIDQLGQVFKMLGESILAVVAPITTLVGVTGAMMAPIAALVGLFDPSIVQQFTLAIRDTLAVIGEILRPIIATVIPIIQQLGDVIATMAPAFQPIITFFVEFLRILASLFAPVARILTPILGLLGGLLQQLIPLFEAVAYVIRGVADALAWTVNKIIDLINLLKFWGDSIKNFSYDDMSKRSSIGKAVRGTERMGGEELGKKFRESAYGASVNWKNEVDQIKAKLDEANKKLSDLVYGPAIKKYEGEHGGKHFSYWDTNLFGFAGNTWQDAMNEAKRKSEDNPTPEMQQLRDEIRGLRIEMERLNAHARAGNV